MNVDGQESESSPSSGAGSMESASENFKEERQLRSESHALMYRAAFEGDWETAQIVLQMDPKVVREKITENGDTALHVAAFAKQTKFVKKLVKKMNPDDLLEKNGFEYTAFIYAVGSGIVKIAAVMREKWPDLVTCCKEGERKPIYWAALHGHADMVSYLYEFTELKDMSTK